MPEFMQLMENWRGFNPVSKRGITNEAAAEFIDLMTNRAGMLPHRHEFMVKEVITTDSFPELFGFTLEREMIARYQAAMANWGAYCASGKMPNFNAGEKHKVQGNDTLLPRVVEKGEYLVSPVSQGHYDRRVYKWGRQFDISWEATINDVLDAFDDLPERFAEASRYSRAYEVSGLLADAAGPDVLTFGIALADVADGQLITNAGNLPLTIADLETTIGLMAAQTDVNGRPLGIEGVHIVVPPLLKLTCMAILTSAFKYRTEVGAGGGVLEPARNVLADLPLQMHVDPLLPIINTTSGNTAWYLFADPVQGRAIQMDYLRGHEAPEIVMKASDKVTVAGAPMSPFSGDFATDNIFYRVRDVFGGARLDRRYCYSQDGTRDL